MKSVYASLCALTLLVAGGCQRASPDADPSEHTGDTPAKCAHRIASLSPGITATLIDRGHGACIVARHGWDSLVDQDLPIAGDQNQLDYETLLRSEPTHVLLQWGSRAAPTKLVELASERDWVVGLFGSLSWDEIASMEQELDAMLGPPPAEVRTRPLRMNIQPPSDEQRAARQRVGPVLLLLAGGEIAALGPGSFHHTMLVDHLGAHSVLTSSGTTDRSWGQYARLHAEDVVRLAPQAIVILHPRGHDQPATDPFDPAQWRALLGGLTELGLPALTHGQVGVLDHPLALYAGSSLADVQDQLAAIVDHWAARHAEQDNDPESQQGDGERPDTGGG